MKARIVRTKIWEDEFFSELTRAGKLLFLYLITNHRINISGCYELPDRVIMFETGLNKTELLEAKKEVYPKAGFFEGWVYIPNAKRLNSFKGPKNEEAFRNEMELVPENVKNALISTKQDRVSKGYPYPMDTSSNKYPVISNKYSVISKKKAKESRKKNDKNSEARGLLDFYNELFGKNLKSTKSFEGNLKTWREDYTLEDIRAALESARRYGWLWRSKSGEAVPVTLELLLRTKNANGPCDYVGQLLERKSAPSEAAGVRVRKGEY